MVEVLNLIQRICSFLFPQLCPVCDRALNVVSSSKNHEKDEELLCSNCTSLLSCSRVIWEQNCQRCNLPLRDEKCSQQFCQGRRLFFDQHLSLYYYRDQRWRQVTEKWKFKNDRRLFRLFLPRLREALPILRSWGVQRVVYIDSSSAKKKQDVRSYQPCLDLARVCAQYLRCSHVVRGVIKKKKSGKQSHQNYQDRFFAIHNSFYFDDKSNDWAKYRVLLVEDIYTTGATANEAARILKMNAVDKVYVISVLHALHS